MRSALVGRVAEVVELDRLRAAAALFGVRCALALDARWAAGLLHAWRAGRSSLRT
jgi:hypothetical protein